MEAGDNRWCHVGGHKPWEIDFTGTDTGVRKVKWRWLVGGTLWPLAALRSLVGVFCLALGPENQFYSVTSRQ